ncbi:DMT family transporter [Actibacterium pelagium]|uniref:Multidrug transporter n=1 Tax=Actibacterium pelagium TaxID=2029103 RepID=A0A917ELE5_9RHOB|nr:DMT family transporter [Actibacterium pelagium]GGE51691.1 multidrug transporter [Actibacterium pelagium]
MLNWALILLLGLSWGSSFFFNEILLRELGPMWISVGRVGIGALGCWVWIFLSRRSLRVSAGMWLGLGVFGLFQYAVPLTVYPATQQFITSSAAGIINAMTPIMVVIVSHFWPDGERATRLKSLGVALGFAGIIVLALPDVQADEGSSTPVALLATMISPFCYGIAMNLLRSLAGIDRVLMTAWSLTIATVMVLPIAFAREGVPTITRVETWASLLVIGLILTSAAFILLYWLVPRVGGTTASTITFVAPISAVLLGVFILNETLTLVHLLGMAIIFVGLLFIDGRVVRLLRNHQPNG